MSLVDRFFAKISPEPNTGCWLWTGCTNTGGYGQITLANGNPGGQAITAHRLSYVLRHGEIPKGLFLDHICRMRICVNPNHLRIVTPRVNVLENSVSPAALNLRKTHCKSGHEFTPDNLVRDPTRRTCKECRRQMRSRIGKARRQSRVDATT